LQKDLIKSDPKVMIGKPVIAGTRITVALILEKLLASESFLWPHLKWEVLISYIYL